MRMRQVETFSDRTKGSRLVFIGVACVLAASLVGYLVGLSQEPYVTALPRTTTSYAPSTVMSAVSYSDMDVMSAGPNAGWKSATVAELAGDSPPPPVYEDQEQLLALKKASLAERAENRAFNGAPPLVPHPIDGLMLESCMACHGEGLALGEVRAPRMSHEYYTNCVQCHAPLGQPFQEVGLDTPSVFVGLRAPLEGARAWEGAPPIIPHATYMRNDCMSCHGPAGAPGLRTSHPERHNCQQCHAPSAELDQASIGDFDESGFMSIFDSRNAGN